MSRRNAGKGSRRRSGDNAEQYRNNFDRIFRKGMAKNKKEDKDSAKDVRE